MKIFLPVASGNLARIDGLGKILSRRAFKSMQTADDYVDEFKKKCVTPLNEHDLQVLSDDKSLRIYIETLDLIEE